MLTDLKQPTQHPKGKSADEMSVKGNDGNLQCQARPGYAHMSLHFHHMSPSSYTLISEVWLGCISRLVAWFTIVGSSLNPYAAALPSYPLPTVSVGHHEEAPPPPPGPL